jgi:C1A family cysteine protease
MTKRQYGWVPDLPDQRDAVHSVLMAPHSLPDRIDLRADCSPVEDQGNLGSCTANAIAGALEYMDKRAGRKFWNRSRLFIYYQERVLERSVPYDSGAMIRDGIKACHNVGVCDERLWPYKVARFAEKPSGEAYQHAMKEKISSYARVLTLDTMLATLAQGYPVVYGFTVYESFESAAVARTGVVPMPGPREQTLGGHAVLAVGYDKPARRALVRNSWGRVWGIKGYFWMPFDYLAARELSDDFWVIRA